MIAQNIFLTVYLAVDFRETRYQYTTIIKQPTLAIKDKIAYP